MTHPYTAPIPPPPPPPRPPDSRPLRKRVLVWVGGAALFLAGVTVGSTGADDQQTVKTTAKPATTVTATATRTASPKPAPTVTETVKPKAKPGPTVTVTSSARAKAAESGSGARDDSGSGGSSSGSSQEGTGTCTIVSAAGNCYAAGQFCRNADHGSVTSTASGRQIKCSYSAHSWRWTYN